MMSTLRRHAPNNPHWEPKYPFDLVIAYEDSATRNHAVHLYDRLAQRLLDDYDFRCTWWRFEFLEDATLFEQATDAGTEANMIVISLREGRLLPVPTQAWLEAVAERRDFRKCALVGLIAGLTPDRRHESGVLSALHKAALRGKMDFFVNTFDPPAETTELSFEKIDQRVHAVTPLLAQILHQHAPFPRGINE